MRCAGRPSAYRSRNGGAPSTAQAASARRRICSRSSSSRGRFRTMPPAHMRRRTEISDNSRTVRSTLDSPGSQVSGIIAACADGQCGRPSRSGSKWAQAQSTYDSAPVNSDSQRRAEAVMRGAAAVSRAGHGAVASGTRPSLSNRRGREPSRPCRAKADWIRSSASAGSRGIQYRNAAKRAWRSVSGAPPSPAVFSQRRVNSPSGSRIRLRNIPSAASAAALAGGHAMDAPSGPGVSSLRSAMGTYVCRIEGRGTRKKRSGIDLPPPGLQAGCGRMKEPPA